MASLGILATPHAKYNHQTDCTRLEYYISSRGPEETDYNLDSNKDTLPLVLRCLLKAHEDDAATSPLSQSLLGGRPDRRQNRESREGTRHRTRGTKRAARKHLRRLRKVGEVCLEAIDLDERMAAGLSEMNARLDIISNTMDIQRNSIATRFYATIHPLAVPADNGISVQQGISGKTVAWYWKCHNLKYIDRLVQLHEFYSTDFNNWYNSSSSDTDSDSDSDSDSTDLTRLVPEPSSTREAAYRQPKYAVMALFSHLGLPYHVFEEQTDRSHVTLTERKRGKDDEDETKESQAKQRYMGRDRVSFSGSPTNANVSSTPSALSSQKNQYLARSLLKQH